MDYSMIFSYFGLALFPIIFIILSIFTLIDKINMKKNRILVNTIVKDIKIEKLHSKKDTVFEVRGFLKCSFNYKNEVKEKKLTYDDSLRNVQIGDKLTCYYNPMNDILETKSNGDSKIHYIIYIFAIVFTYMFLTATNILKIDYDYLNSSIVVKYIVIIMSFLVFFVCGLVMYKKGSKPKEYVIVDGTVIENRLETKDAERFYFPVYEFEYENRTLTYESTSSGKRIVGDKVKLFYDPINDIVFEENEGKSSKLIGLALIILSFILLLSALFE